MLLKNFRSKLILMVYAIILLFCNILYNTDLSANELIIYEKQGFSSKFQDINGTDLDLNNFEGKLILVNLWATWCEPCKEEMPSLDRLQKKFDKEIVLADIPGLIEGAHEGKGLGDKFLAHIERCKILLHLVDSSDPNWKENYYVIRKELEKYGQNLSQKEEVIALSKEDLNPEMTNKVINEMTKLNTNKKFSISSFNNNGVEDLTSYLFEKCEIEDDQ